MANTEKKAKKPAKKVQGICPACARQGDKATKTIASHGLCGSHLQGVSKMIAANKAAIAEGKPAPFINKQTGKPVSFEVLESLKLAVPAQRRSGVSDIFLA